MSSSTRQRQRKRKVESGNLNKLLEKNNRTNGKGKDLATVTLNENDRFKQAAEGTVRDKITVQPVHTPLSAPTKEFLENYDLIRWDHAKKKPKRLTDDNRYNEVIDKTA